MSTEVRLEPITPENVKAVFDLSVTEAQATFVAPNSWSLAEALAHGDIAWPRAICVGDDVVGFVMLHAEWGLWRLMVAPDHQGSGYGAAAVRLAGQEMRRRGHDSMETSWEPGEGCPEPFYRRLGFEPTGEIDDGEVVAAVSLDHLLGPAEATH